MFDARFEALIPVLAPALASRLFNFSRSERLAAEAGLMLPGVWITEVDVLLSAMMLNWNKIMFKNEQT